MSTQFETALRSPERGKTRQTSTDRLMYIELDEARRALGRATCQAMIGIVG